MATSLPSACHNLTFGSSNDSFLCGPAPRMAQCNAANVSPGIRPARRDAQPAQKPRHRRRNISPQAGRAIEMLGHAIDYLADEYALDCMTRPERALAGTKGGIPPQVAAIELLKARNREIYFSCPEMPTLGERLRSWLHLQRA